MEMEASAVQLLDEDGHLHEHEDYPLSLDPAQLVDMYQKMVLVRLLDQEAIRLQRQGVLNLWPPVYGQEAAQVGSGLAIRDGDYIFPQAREFGVAVTLGLDPQGIVDVWQGTVQGGGWDPTEEKMALFTFPIGTQACHAIGYAMGMQLEDADGAVVCYIGDGAFGTGDLHESFVWASVFRLPIVYCCQNNQYALSVPVERQTASPLFRRAEGFGFPGIQVDGNDVLACYSVVDAALTRAREGGGPMLVEAFTYRLGPHTTSDDPTRYRSSEEESSWLAREPLRRMHTWLLREGTCNEGELDAIHAEAAACALEFRERSISRKDTGEAGPKDLRVFDHVYSSNLPPHLQEERQSVEDFEAAARPVE